MHEPIETAILEHPIDPVAYRLSLPPLPDCGGYASFEGLIRNHNHGRSVTHLEYEAYDALALKEMRRIAEEALERFDARFVRVIHRKGRLEIGDTAVLIQVLGRHRDEAFKGCRYVIDELKRRVPIWKREHYESGAPEWTRCHHEHG